MEKYDEFLESFGRGRPMVLSTSEGYSVSSRMMSVVRIGGEFWFQTDRESKKYRQLSANKNAALCADNIQIEGICEEKGHPLENAAFCEIYQACFKGSFDAYSSLRNERLFVLRPRLIERWVYKEGVPYIETFDIANGRYACEKYSGV